MAKRLQRGMGAGVALIAAFACLPTARTAVAGLENYHALVVSDGVATSAERTAHRGVPTNAVRVTYLGVNGYEFETGSHVLLVDPYFTRVGLWSAGLDTHIQPDPERISEGLKQMRSHADAVLVTHAHFDHLLDVPEVMRRTGARLYADASAVHLVESLGISPNECRAVQPGSRVRLGPWSVRVLRAQHDTLFGLVPFPGKAPAGVTPPKKASDWVEGVPLAFLIEAADKKIYVDSGGRPGFPPENIGGHVDLAILGVALPDSRKRYAEIVRQLQPRYILPSHQDDFFAPLDRGFTFGKMTDFPDILHQQEQQHLPGRVVLLNYFYPWTLR